jgi:tRNA (cmo5U34)-methyltransferase
MPDSFKPTTRRPPLATADSPIVFDESRAATYDKHMAKVAPLVDALRLLTRLVLAELPTHARILCVGVGTGAELVDLAQAFPQWQFTAVEPAEPMLAICRAQAEAHGITGRCSFHHGYLDSLPASAAFDGATSLLVSHFFMNPAQRSEFFRQIAARLRPGGILVTSDLSTDMATTEYKELLILHKRMLRHAEYSEQQIEQFCSAYGRDAAVLPAAQVAAIIRAGGFESPVQFFQAVLIHAWCAKRSV